MCKNAEMSEAGKAARAAYWREYRKRNPDKVRQYEIRKWERRAAEQAGNVPAEGIEEE